MKERIGAVVVVDNMPVDRGVGQGSGFAVLAVSHAEIEARDGASAAVPASVTENRVAPRRTVHGRGVVLCMSRPEREYGDEWDECEDTNATSVFV
jgi:hypothetical protein